MSLLSLLVGHLQKRSKIPPNTRGFFRQQLIIWIPLIQFICLIGALVLAALLPVHSLRRKVWVDESALGPGSAHRDFGAQDVQHADALTNELLQRLRSSSTDFDVHSVLHWAQEQMDRSSLEVNAINVPSQSSYAAIVSNTPRSTAREAIILAADVWSTFDVKDQAEGQLVLHIDKASQRAVNVRGITLVISMIRHMQSRPWLAKDLVFVVCDGPDGLARFMNDYDQITTSVIQLGLSLDYPSDTFTHTSLRHHSINGQSPNLDWVATIDRAVRSTADVPVFVHDISDHLRMDRYPAGSLRHSLLDTWHWKKYEQGLRTLIRGYQKKMLGRPDSLAGYFIRWRIEGVGIFAAPTRDAYQRQWGIHAMGNSIECGLRSANSLLERLHASVNVYHLTDRETFNKVPNYLLIAILPGTAFTLGGLRIYLQHNAFLSSSSFPNALGIIGLVFSVYALLAFSFVAGKMSAWGWAAFLIGLQGPVSYASICESVEALRATLLILLGLLTPVIAFFNWPLACLTGLLSLPLCIPPAKPDQPFLSLLHTILLILASPTVLLRLTCTGTCQTTMQELLRDYTRYGNWTSLWLFGIVGGLYQLGATIAVCPVLRYAEARRATMEEVSKVR